MKCAICGKRVEETFLGKPKGTYIKALSSKQKLVCAQCQKGHTQAELKAKL
jgi:hypothetical protein